jgi:tetratricopeptide (TPR) repeat protein
VGEHYGFLDRAAAWGADPAAASSRSLRERALRLSERAFGPDHDQTAQNANRLAVSLHDQGNLAEAQTLYERAVQISSALGTDPAQTALFLDNLAMCLHDLGEFAAAQARYEQALDIKKNSLDPHGPPVAVSLNRLASLYYDIDHLADSRLLATQAREIWQAQPKPDLDELSYSVYRQGRALHAEGRLDAARPLLQEAVNICQGAESLGPDHPQTAYRQYGLALLLHAQGEPDEARALLERALAILEKQDRDHPEAPLVLCALADVLRDQQQLGQAHELARRALRIRERRLGPHHPDTAESLSVLAAVLRDQGDRRDARELTERALRIREQRLGIHHRYTIASRAELTRLR